MAIEVHGSFDPWFEGVSHAFGEVLEERPEGGAALCAFADGICVVDLWGGTANPHTHAPWRSDTLVNGYSTMKPILAIAVFRLVSEGLLDLDAPLHTWWPELSGQGRERLSLRHVLSHAAGLPAIAERLEADDVYDHARIVAALERQPTWWTPGEAHGYHVNTYGFLLSEVVRRVTGHSIGVEVRDRIAGFVGADVHVGLPVELHPRVAESWWPGEASRLRELAEEMDPLATADPDALADADSFDASNMEQLAYFNPPTFSGYGIANTTEWRSAEVPATNAQLNARGLASIVSRVVGSAAADNVYGIDAGILADAKTTHAEGPALVLGRNSRFGLGWQLAMEERPFGPNPQAYGHYGAGGTVVLGDDDANLSLAYVHNELNPGWKNPWNQRLIDAVYACI